MRAALEWIGVWALITAVSIFGAYHFIKAWDATAPEWEKNGSVLERDLAAWMKEGGGDRTKTTGFGFYDRKRERGR